MKILHTLLTFLLVLAFFYSTFQVFKTFTYFNENNISYGPIAILAICIGNYLIPIIVFVVRYFVGTKIKNNDK